MERVIEVIAVAAGVRYHPPMSRSAIVPATVFVLVLAVACDPSGSDDDGDGNGSGTDGDGGVGPDDDDDENDDEDDDGFPSCWYTCETPADCAGDTAINDADNYDCTDGLCRYRGCNSTAECVATYQTDTYACGMVGVFAFPTCAEVCGSPADCALASAAYDADNYRCNAESLCEYLGCNSDAECQAGVGPAYVCAPGYGGVDSCVLGCASPADCAVPTAGPLYGEDNYECADEACRFIGCHDSSECAVSLQNEATTCAEG